MFVGEHSQSMAATRARSRYAALSEEEKIRWRGTKPKNTEAARLATRKYQQSPKGRYRHHLLSARRRGIEFKLTFEEWWALWEPYWKQRGPLGMVMARHGDTGPYAVGNVSIVHYTENVWHK